MRFVLGSSREAWRFASTVDHHRTQPERSRMDNRALLLQSEQPVCQRGFFWFLLHTRMWPILKKTGIAPAVVQSAYDDDLMLPLAGIGFTDVGCGVPGTDRSKDVSFCVRIAV